ncbi:cytochrome P450 [Streptomyces sp. MNU77]|uniref:cytochrome P450 n=1 Tax=Streptomyces sp. MNU77 TaxID=1573406 RepID=UPI000698957A|nr:cytochrome P450 [Streptomyces sp. MNU77]OLO25795.1 cytochrome P450 [Streptomyces sp. MNU77]
MSDHTADAHPVSDYRGAESSRTHLLSAGGDHDVDLPAFFAECRRRGDILAEDLHDRLGVPRTVAMTTAASGLRDFDGPVYSAVGYDAVASVLRDDQGFDTRLTLRAHEPFLGRTVFALEGEEHRAHRGLVMSAFSRKAVDAWEREVIEPLARDSVAALRAGGRREADLLADFVFAFPGRVITALLGEPPVPLDVLMGAATAMVTFSEPERAVRASRTLYDWIAEMVDRRRHGEGAAAGGADLISRLLRAQVEGARLTDEEIIVFVRQLYPAGFDTTFRALGNAVVGLLTTGQWQLVVDDPELVPQAVEEALRWETSVTGVPRYAVRDVEVCGTVIPAGSAVLCFTGSANHDERYWPNPQRYDLTRATRVNATFGFGIHRCLGLVLARREMAAALHALRDHLPGLRLRPGSDDELRVRGLGFRQPAAIPVLFDALPR